jgi:hypothetical protein
MNSPEPPSSFFEFGVQAEAGGGAAMMISVKGYSG